MNVECARALDELIKLTRTLWRHPVDKPMSDSFAVFPPEGWAEEVDKVFGPESDLPTVYGLLDDMEHAYNEWDQDEVRLTALRLLSVYLSRVPLPPRKRLIEDTNR